MARSGIDGRLSPGMRRRCWPNSAASAARETCAETSARIWSEIDMRTTSGRQDQQWQWQRPVVLAAKPFDQRQYNAPMLGVDGDGYVAPPAEPRIRCGNGVYDTCRRASSPHKQRSIARHSAQLPSEEGCVRREPFLPPFRNPYQTHQLGDVLEVAAIAPDLMSGIRSPVCPVALAGAGFILGSSVVAMPVDQLASIALPRSQDHMTAGSGFGQRRNGPSATRCQGPGTGKNRFARNAGAGIIAQRGAVTKCTPRSRRWLQT